MSGEKKFATIHSTPFKIVQGYIDTHIYDIYVYIYVYVYVTKKWEANGNTTVLWGIIRDLSKHGQYNQPS
jgi:hypothetical protein